MTQKEQVLTAEIKQAFAEHKNYYLILRRGKIMEAENSAMSSFVYLTKVHKKLNIENYSIVHRGIDRDAEGKAQSRLTQIYTQYNCLCASSKQTPITVGDIIVIQDKKKIRAYYVDPTELVELEVLERMIRKETEEE